MPAPAPAVTGAMTNAAGTVITITFNKAMTNPAGKHAGFTYKIGSRSAQPFSAVVLNADPTKIDLKTSGTQIAYGDTVTVSYTGTDITARDTGVLEKFRGQAVDNSMPIPAPIVTGVTTNAAGTVITITFNKAMTNPAGKHAGFTYKIGSRSAQPFSATVLNADLTKIDLKTSGTPIAYGDTVTVSYNGTDITAIDGGVFESFADRAVDNVMPVPAPVVTGATTNATGTVIILRFNKAMNNPAGKHAEFIYQVNGGSAQSLSAAALNVYPIKIDLRTSSTPIAYGDTVTVSYTGTDITATDGGVLESFRGQSVDNAMPVPAPVVTGATTNATGTVITLRFNKAMNNPAGKHAEFTYHINGGSAQSISAAALNADPMKIDLTTSGTPIAYGDTVTVSYTGTDITATDGGVLESFGGLSDENAIPAPAITGATTNAAGTIITLRFNKAMNNPAGKHAEFIYQVNGGLAQSISAAALNADPTKIDLTTSGTPIAYGDTVTVSYTGTDITATDDGVLISFAARAVDNAMPVPAPAITGATTNAAGTVITITFNKAMTNPTGKHAEFTYQINGGSVQSISAAVLNAFPTKIDLKTSGTPIAYGDTITLSYAGTDITATDGGVLESIRSLSVDNAMPVPAPAITGATTNAAGTVITITFNKAMNNPADKHAEFAYHINGGTAQSISAAALNADPTKIDLKTSGTPIAYGDTITVSYAGTDITATDGGVFESIGILSVDNAMSVPAPAITGATTNAAGTVITITFNKAMTNPAGKHAGFTYKIGSRSAQAFSAAALNADPMKIDLITSGMPITCDETVTLSYTGTDITATDDSVLATFTDFAVTSNVPGVVPKPSLAALNVDTTKIDLTTSGAPIAYDKTVLDSYTDAKSVATDSGVLVSFGGLTVNNAIPAPTAVAVTEAATNSAGTVITIMFNKAMNDPAGRHAEFTYQINGGSVQSFSAAALNADPTKIDLTTSGTPIAYGDTITVSYTGTDITATDGDVLVNFTDLAVTNNLQRFNISRLWGLLHKRHMD
jgi:FKBP-type peptidyl-prolyl cis-trans isomerase